MDPKVLEKWNELETLLTDKCVEIDMAHVRRAFEFAQQAHEGQKRRSGAPFLTHTLSVAIAVAKLLEQRTDASIIAVALLHDVIEDTGETLGSVEKAFGKEITTLVDGVTKISTLSFETPEAHQAENYRKLILAMATDLRVILVKLCDRLHNMRTLQYMSPEKQKLISLETREIYAPLAHRLGIAKLKWELEDLALKYLDAPAYKEIATEVAAKRAERERIVEQFRLRIADELKRLGIKAEVSARPKHFYSIYNKSRRTGIPFGELHDLLGSRVITRQINDCYRVLGIIHGLYTPVADRFDDYIATPKSNMYQSLHTTVYGPEHHMVEVQIRTWKMHQIAEFGVAAHYTYKEGGRIDREIAEKLSGIVQDASEGMEVTQDPKEVVEFLRTSFYQDEVFVFTPKGDLIQLPRGSTPVDFAYAVHTDLGNSIVGAKVNGRFLPLRHELKNGETVQVITSSTSHPSDDWLTFVKSPKAKTKIRQAIRARLKDDAIDLARELLEKSFKKEGKKVPRDKALENAAQALGFPSTQNLLAAVGAGDLSPQQVYKKVHPPAERANRFKDGLQKIRSSTPFRPGRGIKFGTLDNLMFRVARCCSPIPGERVVGVITRGRGISVHKHDCPNAFEERVGKDRRVEIEWDVEGYPSFLTRLVVYGMERQSLLADLANAISTTKTNIKRADIESFGSDARGVFLVEVQNVQHLQRVIRAVKKVRGVMEVVREQLPQDADLDEDQMVG